MLFELFFFLSLFLFSFLMLMPRLTVIYDHGSVMLVMLLCSHFIQGSCGCGLQDQELHVSSGVMWG